MAEGDDPFSQRFQVLGAERKADAAARPNIVGGTFGVAHRLHRGTSGHAALELFRNIAGSAGTGDQRAAEWLAQATRFDAGNDQRPDATAHFALSLVPGHDDLKARLDE